MSKKLKKYTAAFDYFNKALIFLSTTSGEIFIICFTRVIGVPLEITCASFSLIFTLTTGIVKKFLEMAKNKKKKHNKILMLAKIKLNSIEKIVYQTLIDPEISHEEFKTIINKDENCRKVLMN